MSTWSLIEELLWVVALLGIFPALVAGELLGAEFAYQMQFDMYSGGLLGIAICVLSQILVSRVLWRIASARAQKELEDLINSLKPELQRKKGR